MTNLDQECCVLVLAAGALIPKSFLNPDVGVIAGVVPGGHSSLSVCYWLRG
jgi:hypothetical protein